MKYFICLCAFILSSGYISAEDLGGDYSFVEHHEKSSFVISATTGLPISTAQSQLFQLDNLRNTYAMLSKQGFLFDIPDQRQAYLKVDRYSAEGKIKIAEKIGHAGMQAYARSVNYQPIYESKPGQGQGFDAVFRVGKQIVVVEAKGGSSQPKIYRGYQQGTLAYTLKVADYVKNSETTSIAAKTAAQEVIKAAQEGRLVIQIATTPHVDGTPRNTKLQTTYGEINLPSTLQVAHRISMYAGFSGAAVAGAFDLTSQWASGQPVDWQRFAVTSVLGGGSAYSASLSGIATQRALTSNRTALLVELSTFAKESSLIGSFAGGMTASTLFSYGFYFLGYTDLESANRSMTAGLIGTAMGSLTTIGLMSFATAFGTASTGTAIASLSGVAATNAAMAWLGGGAVSAGGLGVAGGAVILTGGTALIVIAASGTVMYLFKMGDEKAEQQRVEHLLTNVNQHLMQ